jgi:hypothetical protein
MEISLEAHLECCPLLESLIGGKQVLFLDRYVLVYWFNEFMLTRGYIRWSNTGELCFTASSFRPTDHSRRYYTGDNTYNDMTKQALLFQAGPDHNYEPENQTRTEVFLLLYPFYLPHTKICRAMMIKPFGHSQPCLRLR